MNEQGQKDRVRERDRGAGFQERRRQADWVNKAASAFSFLSWLISFFVLVILERAAPEHADFFTYTFGANRRLNWDATLLLVAFVLLVTSVIACVIAFVFNAMRMRRKNDKYKKSILIIGACTIIGLFVFAIRFGGILF